MRHATTRHGRRLCRPGWYSITPAAAVVVAAGHHGHHRQSSTWDRLTHQYPHLVGWLVVAAIAAAAAGLVWSWARRWQTRSRRERMMSLRWRLWLRRHPGRGFARWWELRRGYGLRGARRQALRLYPSLRARRAAAPWWAPWRRHIPAADVATRLGRTTGWPRRRVFVPAEEPLLLVAPPRSGKTGELGNQILDAPGAVLVTSVRDDLVRLTAHLRTRSGPVWVFDPAGVLPADAPWPRVRWSPLSACQDPGVALRRAAFLVNAAETSGVTDRGFWEAAAARPLRAMLHAAALAGYTMADVATWARTGDQTPVRVLRNEPAAAEGWADALEQFYALAGTADATHHSVLQTLANTLDFMQHPGIAEIAGGPAGHGFDVDSWLRERGTLYLIAPEGASAAGLVAPIFTALVGDVWERTIAAGQATAARRVDPQPHFVLDEAPNICRIPLAEYSSTAAGWGIKLMAAIQDPSQLEAVWGRDAAAAIDGNLTTKVVWGGIQRAESRETISKLAGEADFWVEHHTAHHDRDGVRHERHREYSREAVVRPDDLRVLPRGHALVISRAWHPTIVATRPVWLRRAVKALSRHPATTPQPAPAARETARTADAAPTLFTRPPVPQPAPPAGEDAAAVAAADTPDPAADPALSDRELAALLGERENTDGWSVPPLDDGTRRPWQPGED